MANRQSIKSRRELDFAVFCSENVAAALGKTSGDVYRALSDDSGILHQYIVPNYDVQVRCTKVGPDCGHGHLSGGADGDGVENGASANLIYYGARKMYGL